MAAPLLSWSQLDGIVKWSLVLLCRGVSTWEGFSYFLSFCPTPLSSLPLSLQLSGLLKPFESSSKGGGARIVLSKQKAQLPSKYLYRDQQWWTQDYGRSADTALRCFLSIPAVVFKPKTLEPRGGALHKVNHRRKPLRLGTQTVLSIIFGECLTNTRGFFQNQFFWFSKGNIIYKYYIIWNICI